MILERNFRGKNAGKAVQDCITGFHRLGYRQRLPRMKAESGDIEIHGSLDLGFTVKIFLFPIHEKDYAPV